MSRLTPVSMRRQRGFSLLELMVVLALIAILALMAAPSMADWMRNQHIRGTAETLQTGIEKAREEAIRRNRPVSFWLVQPSATSDSVLDDTCTLSDTSGSWVVSVHDPATQCASEPSVTASPMLVAAHAAGARAAVQATRSDGTTPANVIRFNAFGRIANGSEAIANIDIKEPNDMASADDDVYRSLRLVIQGSGLIRLCDPALSVTGTDPRRCF